MFSIRDTSTIFIASEEYDYFYQFIKNKSNEIQKLDLKYVFLIAASIGFKNSYRLPFNKNGSSQFRANYLTPNEEMLVLNMVLADRDHGGTIEKLIDEEMKGTIKTLFDEYANGGMKMIFDNVFADYWDGERLSPNYNDYHYDLSRFIYSQITAPSF